MSKFSPKRRALLASLAGGAGAAVLGPFIPQLQAQQQVTPVRYCHWLDGTMPVDTRLVTDCYPKSSGALQYPEDKSFAPLNAFKEKLLMVRGMHRDGLERGDGCQPHVSKGAILLSSYPASGGRGFGSEPFDWGGKVSSVDQWLAREIAAVTPTPISSLLLGFRNAHGSNESSSFADGVAVARHRQPADTFQALLPYGMIGAGGNDNFKRLARANRSILDFTQFELSALTPRVSLEDRDALDAHATSIRELETELTTIENNAGAGDPLAALDEGWNWADDVDTQRVDLAHKYFIPMIRLALSADLTRIAGGQWGSHIQSLSFAFLNIGLTSSAAGQGGVFHAATHDGGNVDYQNGVTRYRCEMFALLLAELDAVMEPNGKTLLDNTIVHWATDVPYSHSDKDIHTILAGGGSHFQMGRMVETNGAHNAQLLREIGKALGHDGYGLDEYASGGLPLA